LAATFVRQWITLVVLALEQPVRAENAVSLSRFTFDDHDLHFFTLWMDEAFAGKD